MIRPTAQRLSPLLVVLAALVGAPTAAQGAIVLKTGYAGPIAASNKLCTAEPRALIYGTNNFDPQQPLTHLSDGIPPYGYTSANAPSTLDLIPATLAGGRNDLCLGFTLPPDVEPGLVRDLTNITRPRLQDDPVWPDDPLTHVAASPPSDPAPQGDDLDDLSITLPEGYGMAFGTAPHCSDAVFGLGRFSAPACPADTKVGEAFVRLSGFAAGAAAHATVTGAALSNLTPAADEIGRFGVSVKAAASLAPTKLVIGIGLAADGSGRLVARFQDVPRTTIDANKVAIVGSVWGPSDTLAAGDPRLGLALPTAVDRPLYVEGVSLRPWGAKADHPTLAADFGAWGSRCDTSLSASLSATTYDGQASALTTAPFQLSGCASLALPATAAITTSSSVAGDPTGALITVSVPQAGTRGPVLPTALNVVLPSGLELGPQLASGDGGQSTCAPDQFAAASSAAPACPAASSLGTVQLDSPLAATPLVGTIYLAPPPVPGGLAGLFLDAALGTAPTAPRLKLVGHLSVASDGRVTLALPVLPALRFSALRLTLRGGPNAVLTNPVSCGEETGSVALTRAADAVTAPDTADLTLATAEACAPPALTPSLAGAAGTTTSVTLRRPERAPRLTTAAFTLPSGLLLAPGAAVACSALGAEAGVCGDESRVGTVRLRLGAGSQPVAASGTLFIASTPAGAYGGGVIVAPLSLGDVPLGSLVAPVRFDLTPGDARLAVTVDLPSRVGGVAIDLRELTLELGTGSAFRQPSACSPLPWSATATGDDRAASSAAATLTYAGCGARPFQPTFAAAASGESTKGGHPNVGLTLTPRADDAALRSADLTFPAGLALDRTAGRPSCVAALFAVGGCPAAAKVGQAGARIGLTGDQLGGNAYRVQIPGEALPGLGLALDGRFGQRLLARLTVGPGGRLVLRLVDLPDIPLTRLAIALSGGATGLIVNQAGACPKPNGWSAALHGQGGQSAVRQVTTSCGGLAAPSPSIALSVSAKTGLKLKLDDFNGQRLQSVKLTLPKAMRFIPAEAGRRGRTSIVVLGAKGRPKFSGGSALLTISRGLATQVVVRVRTSAYLLPGQELVDPDLKTDGTPGADEQSGPDAKLGPGDAGASAGATAAPKQAAPKSKLRSATFRVRLAFTDGSTQTRSVKVKLR